MFFNAEDDDNDFMSTSGSKLASLFGVDKAANQGGNESLTYTAPKQPKKQEPGSGGGGGSKGSPAILCATAVHAYKYVDSKYASQGKLGAAILANHGSQDYRILLYVSKQQQVTNVKITSTLQYRVQPNNYASFYDDARQNWSIMFDSEQASIQFAKQVGLSMACSMGSSFNSLISQDLSLGEGGALETNDNVEVKYTGWLLTNNTFGQEFDSNVKADKLFRFKIGKGKVIKGWDTGVVGMKKGSKRLLVVPPSLGYGSQGAGSKIPPNSSLIFEIEVVRVKLSKGESPKPSPNPTPEPVPASTQSPAPDLDMEDTSIKGRSKSITEHMSHQDSSKSGKAKLISRMAKMGKPMLPLVGAVPAQASDDEDDEQPVTESPQPVMDNPVHPTKAFTKPVPQHPVVQPQVQPAMPTMAQPVINQQTAQPVINPQPAFLQNIPAAQQLSVYQSPQTLLQQQQAAMLQQQQLQQQQQQAFQPPGYPGQPNMFNGTFPQQTYPGSSMGGPMQSEANNPMLLSETRQQNTELRLTLGKVSDKIDRVMEKIDHMHTQQSGSLALQSTPPNMESSVLMHNIQRIVEENDRLRKELYEKSAKIEMQNNKISELLQNNQMFIEKSQNELQQRNEGLKSSASHSQAKVLSLEQEKVQLATELAEVTSQLSTLQLEIAGLRKKEIELQQTVNSSSQDGKRRNEEFESLQNQHAEDEERISQLSKSLKEEKQKRKSMESKMSQIQEEFTDLKSANESLEKNLNERKRKAAEDRRKLEDEMEDTKINLEQEIQSLRDKLRKQKSSTDVVTAEQVSQVEEELNKEWKDKCDRLVTAAQEKHNRALQDLKEEKEDLERKVEELENKVLTLKTSGGGYENKLESLQEQIEELSVWKDKYNNLRTQATSMKEKYEERINDLEEERDQMEEEKDKVAELVENLKQEQEVKVPSGGGLDSQTLAAEIKKIMNQVYQKLRSEFDADGTYSGTDVLSAILGAIKETTLKLVQQPGSQPSKPETEEAESEDEEEEEEDEEEEEEQDQEEDKEQEEEEFDEEEIKPNTAEEPVATESKTEELEDSSDEEDENLADNVEAKEEINSSISTEQSIEQTNHVDNIEVNTRKVNEQLPDVVNQTDRQEDIQSQSVEVPDLPSVTMETNDHIDSEQPSLEKPVNNENSEKDKIKSKEVEDLSKEFEEKIAGFKSESKENGATDSRSRSLSREPPPLMDDDEDDDEDFSDVEKDKDDGKPLFGDDNTVEDTLGISFAPPDPKTKKVPSKADLANDDDLKPKPPPPLFGDDDDEDDLDWFQ